MIKVSGIGFDTQGIATITFFFNKYCEARCIIVSEDDANVFLINMDHYLSSKDYLRIQKNFPDNPIIMVALKPIPPNKHYFLRKPILRNKLLEIIDDIEKKFDFRVASERRSETVTAQSIISSMEVETKRAIEEQRSSADIADLFIGKNETKPSHNTVKIVVSEKQSNGKVKFNLDNYFLGAIFQAYNLAKKTRSVVKITGLWRPVLLFPDTDEVYVDLSNLQLRSICASSLYSQGTTAISRQITIEKTRREWQLKSCYKTERFYSLENFMWKAAMCTSRGRIPDFIDVNETFIVRSWPNLTRLDPVPEALKLIAYWSASPRSIADAVKKLSVDQKHAFSLFTALYILGYIEEKTDRVHRYDVINNTEHPLSPEESSLLSKVITKLKVPW